MILTLRIRWWAVALSMLALAGASPAFSANGPVPSLPWLHEGLVLTFTWYQALAAGQGSTYEEDANGGWVDQRTGTRLSRSDQRGTSGSGWTQVTIACIEGDRVVVATSSFGNAGALGNNQPVPQQIGSSTLLPVADPGDYWMDPGKLASLHSYPSQHVLVTRVPWKTGDHATEAIRVQVVKPGSYSDHVYDARTGLCLHFASSMEGAPPKYVGPGDMGRGNTTLSRSDFVSARDLSLPWAGQAMPAWVSGLRALHYRGPIVSRGPLPSGNSVFFADMELVARGRGWVQFSSTAGKQIQGAPAIPPGKGEITFGRNQLGGLWIVADALANLRNGQVLDEDPVTRMQTSVTKADNKSVVIASRNAAGEIDSEYDRATGMLIASSFFDVLSRQQSILRLQGRE